MTGPDPDNPGGYIPLHIPDIEDMIGVLAYATRATPSPAIPTVLPSIEDYQLFSNEFIILGASCGAVSVACIVATVVLCRKTRRLRRAKKQKNFAFNEVCCC
jgi:hypothetical protein